VVLVEIFWPFEDMHILGFAMKSEVYYTRNLLFWFRGITCEHRYVCVMYRY
jgi:hypothetical protein